MKTAELFNFNRTFHDQAVLLKVLDDNREEIEELLSDLDEHTEKSIIEDFNKIIKTIKTNKRIKYLDYKRGAPFSFEADGLKIIVPFGMDGERPYFRIKNWPRVKSFQKKLQMLKTALRSNKIDHTWILYKENGKNFLKIECEDPLSTDRFWNILKLTLRK